MVSKGLLLDCIMRISILWGFIISAEAGTGDCKGTESLKVWNLNSTMHFSFGCSMMSLFLVTMS